MTELELEFLLQDATSLAELLAAGALTSEQLTEKTLAAIEFLNPVINCFISVDRASAIAAAKASDERRRQGKLLSNVDGLTLAVKDNIDVAGMVTTAGLNIPADATPAKQDAFVIALLRGAGCVILGKLNLHEAALGASNDNPHHGKCFNPHRLSHTPGGSSGGSGAAVAAGLCAFSLGTDTMGSVRIPASYCGVSGLKPSVGAVSIGGAVLVSRRLDNIGPLARSPRDLALILPLMAGLDTACAQSRAVSFHEGLSPLANLHFAVASDLSHQGVEPEIFAGYQLALQQFTEAGAELTSCDFSQFDCAASRRAGLLVGEVDMYVQQQTQFHAHPEYYSAELTKMMNWGANKGALDVVKADWRLDETCVKMAQLLSGVDFLLLPTAPQTAFDFLSPVPVGQADLTNIANMSGHPAISVPIGLSKAGLPMGLQIIGHYGSDLQLIELAQNFVARANINVAVNTKSLVACRGRPPAL